MPQPFTPFSHLKGALFYSRSLLLSGKNQMSAVNNWHLSGCPNCFKSFIYSLRLLASKYAWARSSWWAWADRKVPDGKAGRGGGTGDQGQVCEVYFKRKELAKELGGKGWRGSGDKMKQLKVDKKNVLVHMCALQKHITKGSQVTAAGWEDAWYPCALLSTPGEQWEWRAVGHSPVELRSLQGWGEHKVAQRHQEDSKGTVVKRLSFDRWGRGSPGWNDTR